ncbi:MAG: hypothetical protein IRZ31_08240 [Thermogemmatispora sp.]|uniref:hypothetical protein n=1 Tax=Thermogemmatispora sp. TaxID=1968838 RepID=UPI0026323E82|nr:hypothetical protein [Thermogemmatispora sp.]MBX5456875.1 hypothetical protein [Thermogemmatispora sp.]
MAVERVGTVPRYYSIVLPVWQEKAHLAERLARPALRGSGALTGRRSEREKAAPPSPE